MSRFALGIIETIGLAAAFEAADTAVKSANVELLGYELTKGNGMATVKIQGDISAVKAAIEAAYIAASKVNTVWSKQVIPRPHEEIDQLIFTRETVGFQSEIDKKALSNQEESKKEAFNIEESKKIKEDFSQIEKLKEEKEGIGEEVQTENQEEKVEQDEESMCEFEEENKSGSEEVCNLCGDPKCPRKKGELRVNCIHYSELKEEV